MTEKRGRTRGQVISAGLKHHDQIAGIDFRHFHPVGQLPTTPISDAGSDSGTAWSVPTVDG